MAKIKPRFVIKSIDRSPIHYIQYDDVDIFWNDEPTDDLLRGFSWKANDVKNDEETPLDFEAFLGDKKIDVVEFLTTLIELYKLSQKGSK